MSLSQILLGWALASLPNPGDLEFQRVQEAWVQAARPFREFPGWVEDLGAPSWWEREWAQQKAQDMGREALPWLSRASEGHRDPEVRDRARKLVDRLFRCPWCLGTGDCPGCPGAERGHRYCFACVKARGWCSHCEGSGDLRFSGVPLPWSGGWADGGRVPRELFGNQNEGEMR